MNLDRLVSRWCSARSSTLLISVDFGICINEIISMINLEMLEGSLGYNGTFGDVFHNGSRIVYFTANSPLRPALFLQLSSISISIPSSPTLDYCRLGMHQYGRTGYRSDWYPVRLGLLYL